MRFVTRKFLVVAISILPALGWSQSYRTLTLEESIQVALGRSFQAASIEQTLLSSRMSLEAAKSGLRSNSEIRLNKVPTFQETERLTPVSGGGYSFDREKFLDFEAQLFVNQPIKLTDGLFSVVGIMRRFEQYNTIETDGQVAGDLSNARIDYVPQLRLQFRQPLFTLNQLSTNFRKAELNLEKTRQSYTSNQLDLVFNVTSNFYQLYKAQQQNDIDNTQVNQSENAYRIANLKYQAGLLPEVEALRLEVDLANSRNKASSSLATSEETEDRFKVLIGLDISDRIKVTTELFYEPTEVTLEKAMLEALSRRTELKTDEIDIELREISVKETDSQREIKGELNLSYGIINQDETFDQAFSNFKDDRSVTFSLTMPLWDWSKNNYEVQAAQANLESQRLTQKNRIEQIKQEIRTAVRNFHSSGQRVDITKRSEALAEKSYKINLLKFENGDLSSQDLALEQNRLTEARVNSLNAIIDYRQALSDLQRKTLWNFEKNESVVVESPE